jgi:hypothetical protein
VTSTTPRSQSARRVLLRLAAGVVLAMGLGGPSPGYTGGCGSSGGMVADARQFCVDKNTYTCARECATGRWDAARCDATCGPHIVPGCMSFGWTPPCAPTQSVTAACIQALRDEALIGTPVDMITECQFSTLCAGSALTSSELTSSEPTEGI